MAIILHGLSNCDTVKKARAWLDQNSVTHGFHDFRKAGVDRLVLTRWVEEHGWEVMLNRAGTTFRGLPDDRKAGLDKAGAIELMLEQPSMIKRPVLDLGDKRVVGFKPETYAGLFGK